ncbi:hypothetical protein V500_02604 [Pseudogymnoascus sp. VKM F-4518 (FW-2643)]|nr:hypothetical protein V500_02604 [Pseudogymnoascus sp. VKM F-4518 (FW-2643)]
MISSSTASQASAGPFLSLTLPINHRRTLYNPFEYEASGLEDSATSSLPEVSETGSWVDKKPTVQIRSMIPAHTTSNQAAQDFKDFTASQQYHSRPLQYILNSNPETEPYVKSLTVSKELTPEDGRSGVNPSHNSKHDHDCDVRGPIPPNCTELALSLSAQPPGRARPGVALEPPIVAQLTCTFADLPQVWAVATLLSHTGEVLLDKLEGKIAEFAHPDTMDFSNGSHPDGVANVCECIESDGILVEAAAPEGDAGSAATGLRLQGKHEEAEAMDQQILKLKGAVLGKGHSDTLTSMNNLAESLRLQGKYAEAEAMHRQTLQLMETVLGKDHPDTLASTNNLAIALEKQGKCAEAEAMHLTLEKQGKCAEAEAMHLQTLQLTETVLGKDHPGTLASMNNLAIALEKQGKCAEAEAMHRQTLKLRETVLGKDHPDTLASINNLAVALRLQRKYAEAEAMRKRAL